MVIAALTILHTTTSLRDMFQMGQVLCHISFLSTLHSVLSTKQSNKEGRADLHKVCRNYSLNSYIDKTINKI